jgi:hypothetical protein
MICSIYAPWFGELPFYADTFLHCCGNSPDIQWIINTDQYPPCELASNIIWILIDCNLRHKLCDYKPWWHLAYKTNTEYIGWCDWDVVHNLSTLTWDFESAKFTTSWMASPLFIVRRDKWLDYWPLAWNAINKDTKSTAWEESLYLNLYDSKILQEGLTPEIDLYGQADYAVHMYGAKYVPELYYHWITKYCNFPVG